MSDFAEDAFDEAGDIAGAAIEGVNDFAGDAVDVVSGVVEGGNDDHDNEADGDRGLDDVDMYAGAGPQDLDDGCPSAGGAPGEVRSGVRCTAQPKHSGSGVGSDIVDPISIRGNQRRAAAAVSTEMSKKRWEDGMFQSVLTVARPEAIPYKMNLHAFHGGRPHPSVNCAVTLVTQCSVDRLPSVLKQALRWGGDISLAVLVPSAPEAAGLHVLMEIRRLCEAIDAAWSSDPSQAVLSLDVATLEGAEADEARHDHCGALYPINALRNLALLQARDDMRHPAPAVFLVDCDCVPSKNLLTELSLPEVQDAVLGGVTSMPRCNTKDLDNPSDTVDFAAIVVPCLEAASGVCFQELGVDPPSTTEEAANLLQKGLAQGFHVDYFPKGHGPTDLDRWAEEAADTSIHATALAYSVPYSSSFEPYVAVAKTAVPMYDERFRGYGMNKVAHLLSLATGNPGRDASETQRQPGAEFVVLRRAFVLALPHKRSKDWNTTYGCHRDSLRRHQIKLIWSAFQTDSSQGRPPVISTSTAGIIHSLCSRQNNMLPPHRVLQSLPPIPNIEYTVARDGLDNIGGCGGGGIRSHFVASQLSRYTNNKIRCSFSTATRKETASSLIHAIQEREAANASWDDRSSRSWPQSAVDPDEIVCNRSLLCASFVTTAANFDSLDRRSDTWRSKKGKDSVGSGTVPPLPPMARAS